jgi:hypothetical protein
LNLVIRVASFTHCICKIKGVWVWKKQCILPFYCLARP